VKTNGTVHLKLRASVDRTFMFINRRIQCSHTLDNHQYFCNVMLEDQIL
jgi:hypothetical protein